MIYKAMGIMSGSSLDGLDVAYVHFIETGGQWNYAIIEANCYSYSKEWEEKLSNAINLSALEYQLLHTAYGEYIGQQINLFIETHQLPHKVDLIASHGHTVFHLPKQKMTAQLGDGAAIAAATKLPVVNELRAMDIALGGQGAPIVPIGEKLLFAAYNCFLNIGGIANISITKDDKRIAFDVCAANRVLNMLAKEKGFAYDDGGKLAASGNIDEQLLQRLHALEYYKEPFPKSLDNSFGVAVVYPLIKKSTISIEDALCTYTEHICIQINNALDIANAKLLVTGGGAFNNFLLLRLKIMLADKQIEVVVPDEKLVQYKEAIIMALMGVLRWREEVNVLSSVTGAAHNSIGGALWLGNAD